MSDPGSARRDLSASSEKSLADFSLFCERTVSELRNEKARLRDSIFAQSRSKLASAEYVDELAITIRSYEMQANNRLKEKAFETVEVCIANVKAMRAHELASAETRLVNSLKRSVLSIVFALVCSIILGLILSERLSLVATVLSTLGIGIGVWFVIFLIRYEMSGSHVAQPINPKIMLESDGDGGIKIDVLGCKPKIEVSSKLYEGGLTVGFRTALNTGRPSMLLVGLAGSALLHAGAWLVNQLTLPPQKELAATLWGRVEPEVDASHNRIRAQLNLARNFFEQNIEGMAIEYFEALNQYINDLKRYSDQIL